MKEKKTNGIIELTAKTAFAGLWRNFKEHPIITLGAAFQIAGLFLGARFLSGCVKTPKEPVKPPYEQTVPSGEIPSGLPGISSGDITSGEEIPSGDITSGDVPPSGDIGSGDVEQKPQLPTDIADLSAEQKTALFNAIEENKDKILRKAYAGQNSSNTDTLGYDINLETNEVTALYLAKMSTKDVYFTVDIDLNNLVLNDDSSISIEVNNFIRTNTIEFATKENRFSPNAENVYLFFNKVILPDNARFSAYSISSQGAFDGGYWPIVITSEKHTVNETIYFNSFNILTDGYEKFTKNSANGARYEEKGGFSFQFGNENTLWRDAIESSNEISMQ